VKPDGTIASVFCDDGILGDLFGQQRLNAVPTNAAVSNGLVDISQGRAIDLDLCELYSYSRAGISAPITGGKSSNIPDREHYS
jgi:hypothetical protein